MHVVLHSGSVFCYMMHASGSAQGSNEGDNILAEMLHLVYGEGGGVKDKPLMLLACVMWNV